MHYTNKLGVALALVSLSIVSTADAQSLIAANRRVDWSQAGSPSILESRTGVCANFSPGATAAQINSAIAACPDGQVVKLAAGTYSLAGGIIFNGKSGVTLRGAGPDQTKLVFTGKGSCQGLGSLICVKNAQTADPSAPSNTATWTGGYAKGATTITLSNTTNLAPGRLLVLDQQNEAADTGHIWNCSTSLCSNGGPAGGGRPTSPRREQLQITRVTAVNGNTVTISPGLYMPNWRAGQNPGAWWANNNVERVGIEDLSIDGNAVDTNHIVFMYAYDSWVKNVASRWAGPRSHVWAWLGKNITVRDSYFFEGNAHGSQSYGVESLMASDLLIENNIFQRVTAPVIFNGASSGSVAAYNYLREMTYTNSPSWMIPSNDNHATGLNMVLTEGNEGTGFIFDNVHGPGAMMTVFRNRFTGVEPGKESQTIPIHIYHYSRFFNVIGNVLGQTGYHNAYTCAPATSDSSSQNCYRHIFTLGWSGNNGQKSSMPNDPLVASTMFRWGNYDTVKNAATFDSSEVPSSLPLYSNPVPSSNALPASLYLPGKPSWFGSVPYPAIGPDVTGGEGPGGRSFGIPARGCFDRSAKQADGSLVFSAQQCYGSAVELTPPGAPTNVHIIR